ncbi:MAG TPA: BatA domain-containing protein [Planctomycetota bacterium]|nr:BatA domain-containing protein [Planctomycetota bacterium]
MDLFSQFFLNPAMLFGTALVAVPIIIYLINRQRYQRRKWAAMEFLLRAMKRNQRRIQFQNLLLLLIRCAVILLLVLAAARPVSRLGVLRLAPDQSQNWVLVLDTSYSMGYQEDSRSTFDQARETIIQMSENLIKPGDQMALMTLEDRPKVILPLTRVDDESRMRLRRELENLRLTSGSVDLGASFALLDELSARFVTELGEPLPKRIIFFTDVQRKDWVAENRPKDAGILEYIDKLQKEGGEFAFARLHAEERKANLVLSSLSVSPALIAKDVWVEIAATVTNLGDEDISNVDLTLRVDRDPEDAAAEPQVGDVIRVPRGGTLTRVLPYRFTEAGYHTVVADLRSDGLLIDNTRYLIVRVEDNVKVLLVDGDPAADPTERETYNLEVALAPEDAEHGVVQGRFTPFEPRYVTPDQLNTVEWKEYAVVVFANVADLTVDQASLLKDYVRGGGALMVFLGSNVAPDAYHTLFRGEEPSLLPVKLEDIRGDKKYPVHLQIADVQHPLAAYFESHKDVTYIQRPIISFDTYYRVSSFDSGNPSARVIFRYTDTEQSAAMFDNAYGTGRVLWVTSTADNDWNEFGSWPDYVVFLYEAMSYLVKFGLSSSNLETGEVFRKRYPAAQYASEVLLHLPEPIGGRGEKSSGVRKAMRKVPEGNDFEIVHEETEHPGLYRLDLLRPSTPGGDTTEHFCVNLDIAESDLKAMSQDDFHDAFPDLRHQVFDASARIEALKGEENLQRGQEHWMWFAAVVLGLLFLESALASYFGRKAK